MILGDAERSFTSSFDRLRNPFRMTSDKGAGSEKSVDRLIPGKGPEFRFLKPHVRAQRKHNPLDTNVFGSQELLFL